MEIEPAPEQYSDDDDVDSVVGLPSLQRPVKVQKPQPQLQQAMENFVQFLGQCAKAESWDDVEKTMKLLWYCSQKSSSFSRLFVQAHGTSIILDIIRAASGPSTKEPIMDYSTAFLFECVRAHEDSSDAVVESDVVRLLLQLLQSAESSSLTKQHIAATFHYLAGAKLLYKDVLHGAGTLQVVLEILNDPVAICNLQVLQELLWTLICLADDDLVYKDLFRETGILQVLVRLLQVYQLPGLHDQAPITALIVRCLHVMSFGDDVSKETLRQLGLVEGLVAVVKKLLDGEGAGPASTPPRQKPAPPETLVGKSSQPGEMPFPPADNETEGKTSKPSSEKGTEEAAAPSLPAETETESKPDTSADSAPQPAVEGEEGAAGSGTSEQPEPADTEKAEADTAAANPAETTEPAARKEEPASTTTTAASKEEPADVEGPVTALERISVCVALRAYAKTKTGIEADHIEMMCHAILLPVLPLPSTWGPKTLDLLKEATGTLKSLMCNSPDNQEVAVKAGLVPCLVRLLHGHSIEVAWEAAEAISYMLSYRDEFVAEGAVESLVYLLRDCARALSLLASTPRAVTPYTPPHISESDNPNPMSGELFLPRLSLQGAPSRLPKLDGRQSTGLVSSGVSGFRDYAAFCGYHVPSVAMKALLRLMTSDAVVQEKVIRAGGLSALFGLLRAEMHNPQSRLASSAVSLLNLVMDNNAACQSEIRRVGGIDVLCKALAAVVQPGVSDVYQLKRSLCMAIKKAVEFSDVNKGIVRDQGGLHSLVALLQQAAMHCSSGDVDDADQGAAAAVSTLCAVVPGISTNQAALNNLGVIPVLAQLISNERYPSEIMVGAVKALGFLGDNNPACQISISATGIIPVMISIADANQTHPIAADICNTLFSVMKTNKFARDAASANGVLKLLITLLKRGANSHTAAAAARALYVLANNDTDIQNKFAEDGGLEAVLNILAEGPGGVAPKYALVLLATVARHNTFAKNTVRNLDGIQTLVKLLSAGLESPQICTLAAGALAELCDSNHSNQDALAAEGGVEQLSSILQSVCGGALASIPPFRQLVEEVARALGNAAELHNGNKALVREGGGAKALANFVLLCGKERNMHTALAMYSMLPTVKEVANAVAKLAQDSEESQYSFATQMYFIPCLFKLLSVEEPTVALEVAKAVEYVAIRSSAADLDEDPFDFEMEAIKVFVKALQLGSGKAAAVTECAKVLRAITSIAEGKPAASGPQRSLSTRSSRSSVGGIDDDDDNLTYVRDNSSSRKLRTTLSGRVSSSQIDDATQGATSPKTTFNHSSGLAVTPGLHDPYSLHSQVSRELPGQGAAAFQSASKLISDSPWRPFKQQVAWMLYLLARRSVQNRELIKHLERTNVAPLAQQLTTAEAFQSTMLLALQNTTPHTPTSSGNTSSPHEHVSNRLAAFLEATVPEPPAESSPTKLQMEQQQQYRVSQANSQAESDSLSMLRAEVDMVSSVM